MTVKITPAMQRMINELKNNEGSQIILRGITTVSYEIAYKGECKPRINARYNIVEALKAAKIIVDVPGTFYQVYVLA